MQPNRSHAAVILASLLLFSSIEGATRKEKRRPSHTQKKPPAEEVAITAEQANDPSVAAVLTRGATGAAVLRAQVLLDRAHFSPGEMDARFGANTQRAVMAFRQARGLERQDVVDARTWTELNRDTAPVLVPYAIVPADVAGPFVKIPKEMMDKAALPALSYESPLEAIAEMFHVSPKLLSKMNPGASFSEAGHEVLVPAVTRSPLPKAAMIRVNGRDLSVAAYDQAGRVLARYPATVGSAHDPLPIGACTVKGVGKNPVFHYNPDLFWDAHSTDTKATIQAGPNNPVGVVWIDLSLPHYGIHGTPEPGTIGAKESHGCIRLTNWDAAELAELVAPGMKAVLER
jgi:lipoprotein-anchoring transpeptidase ErfK/SrfK